MIALERAELIAAAVIKRFEPYCQRIEVAGSIRRKKPWINDIDIVLVPKPAELWSLYSAIKQLGSVKASGMKIMRVMAAGETQIDIYIASEESWATLLLIRTGSTANNIRLCSRAKEFGWQLHADGSGLFNEKGERIAGDTEESIYKTLRLVYQVPEQRG